MADNKHYYYFKLKDNFYDSDEMIILQNMPDGYLYSDILLKLYLRGLKTNGRLMFKDAIPYTPELLAQVVRHQIGTVERALKVFQQLGLVELLDTGAIYMSDIQNFIGKSSTEADRKRAYRKQIDIEKSTKKYFPLNEVGQMSGQMSDKNPPEIEIEKEIDINNNSSSNIIEFTEKELKIIKQLEKWFDEELIKDGFTTTTTFNNNTLNEIKELLKKGYKQKDLGYVLGYLHYYWVEHPEFHKTDMSVNYIPEKIFNVDKFSDRLLQAKIYFSKESD